MKDQKKRIAAVMMLALMAAVGTAGMASANPNAGTETGQSKEIDREKGMSARDTTEKGKTKSGRTSTSKSTGIDKQLQDSARSSIQSQSNSSAEVTLPLESLFQAQILSLEKTEEPFKSCKLLSRPKLPRDYGITAMANEDGTDVDSYVAQALSSLAASNGPVNSFANERMLAKTRRCMALYGGYMGQAYLNVENSIAVLAENPDVQPEVVTVKNGTKPDKKAAKKTVKKKGGKKKGDKVVEKQAEVLPDFVVNIKVLPESGGKRITGIGMDDYIALETEALLKALKEGVQDSRIKALVDQVMGDNSRCYFAGSTDKILCGSSLMILGPQQQLESAGVVVFGKSFAGFNGAYRLSKSSSLSEAFEKLASNSKNEKQMKEISNAVERMAREGHALEASMAKRTAIKQSMGGKKSLDLSGIIPGLKGQ